MRSISVLLVMIFTMSAWEVLAQGCSVTAISVKFGNYDTLVGSTLEGTGEVNVTCDSSVAYTIRLDAGQNSSSFNPRRMMMSGGSGTIDYNIYRNSARSEVWGDGTGNTFLQSGIGTGSVNRFIVYGRIPGAQNVPVGLYTDAVTVTVEW